MFAGLHSGFVTLPRVSRLDRQSVDREAQRRSIPDSGGFTLTRSDSLTSFTVDLGPSLMTEVLNLIDKPCCLQMYSHSQAAGEEEGKHEEEEDDNSSLAETPVQSPRETSPNSPLGDGPFSMNNRERSCSSDCSEQEEDRRSLQTPQTCTGSPQRDEPAIEPERFRRAADVLSRHYGGRSFSKGTQTSTSFTSSLSRRCKTQYAFSEEEEEIKV